MDALQPIRDVCRGWSVREVEFWAEMGPFIGSLYAAFDEAALVFGLASRKPK